MFHLDPQNNKVAISGSITATDGTIGGMSIDESNKLLLNTLKEWGWLKAKVTK